MNRVRWGELTRSGAAALCALPRSSERRMIDDPGAGNGCGHYNRRAFLVDGRQAINAPIKPSVRQD